jgi:periplasmic divalent cation tolerance protein
MPAIQVVTTAPTRELAEQIAGRLVEERLAACVQIDGPIHSTYRWRGGIERDEEWRLTAKTLVTRYDQVEMTIRQLHPYEVPEILAVPVLCGEESYLHWLEAELSES